MKEREFLKFVAKQMGIKNFRYNTGKKRTIKRVAVCGGSGGDLLPIAIQKNADALITADIKYHGFDDARNKILLIDAGHYETEIIALTEVQKRLKGYLSHNNKVFRYAGTTNPVIFFNN
jgi:putative NIF3 family GTP cyclohydrolase 1 type 2